MEGEKMINKKSVCKLFALVLSVAMILTMTVSAFAVTNTYVIFVYADYTSSYVSLEVGTMLGNSLPPASTNYHWNTASDGSGDNVTADTVVPSSTLYVYEVEDEPAATETYVIFVYADNTSSYVSLEAGTMLGSDLPNASTGYHWEDAAGNVVTSSTIVGDSTLYLYEVADSSTNTTNSVDGVIYINETYHGILVTNDGRTHILSVAHTVDNNGYCTVCKAYIGTDGDVVTTSINGGEYVEAYYAEVGINSENDSRWGSKDLGGTDLIEALAQDGAILVITRDGVSDTVFSDDGDFEKFGLVNAWWTGDGWVALGTAGHTSADEEGVVDCLSDDGTTVIYDGATVYAAWQALNLNTGSNTTIISNTSNSLSIVSVAVYVPADAVSVEEVEVTDPQESGETDSEDDGEDLTVDDSEPETPAETNPTTGVVLALVPMAIAGLAVVASKRR